MTAEEARPRTSYDGGPARFHAKPRRTSDLADGMLRLDDGHSFVVDQVDVDGSVIKTIDFAGNVDRVAARVFEQDDRATADLTAHAIYGSLGEPWANLGS